MRELRFLLAVLALALAACAGNGPPEDAMASMNMDRPDPPPRSVLVSTAELRDLSHDLRLVGRVVPAETSVREITTRVDGVVERLYVDYTGREVARGEPLFDLYSPALVAVQQELLLARRLRASLGEGAAGDAAANAEALVRAARRRLEFWDVPDAEVAELERTGEPRRTLTMRAPTGGVVLEKGIVEGQAVSVGATLYRIADLSTVWLEADVFENDLGHVRRGMAAEVTLDAYPGESFRGVVSYIAPTVDAAARTGKARIELANRGGRIRPGLFGTVRITSRTGERGVVIPREAALVTGNRQVVFVQDSAGRFTPRLVTLGMRTDSLVEVKAGLSRGERVAASAAFLLDAESNLGAAMAAMAGMDMGGRHAAPRH